MLAEKVLIVYFAHLLIETKMNNREYTRATYRVIPYHKFPLTKVLERTRNQKAPARFYRKKLRAIGFRRARPLLHVKVKNLLRYILIYSHFRPSTAALEFNVLPSFS